MTTDNQLATQDETPSVALMLQSALSQGVTKDNADALGKLMELYERMEDRNAEKAFAAAFVAVQKELPQITAKSIIPNRGKYERFEDLMVVIQPIIAKHGFTLSFSNGYKDNRVVETCHLTHAGGHTRSNDFAVRIGKGDSETQADCKAATTAKRNALLNALNIVVRQDCLTEEHDPTMDSGETVTKEQADTLWRLVKETGSNEAKFLEWLGAKEYEDIRAKLYDDALSQLQKKMATKPQKLDPQNEKGEFTWDAK